MNIFGCSMDPYDHLNDETVELGAEKRGIVMEPIQSKEYDLDLLLQAITPENVHTSFDVGPSIGNEA